ncbi:hypothetical protein COV24_01765 [candidate division WWE3 bacterium CG10_big_fil_rev_8_21_14_0_10_32_10]|uniref:Uncharacterized protein n=1 Tax=candidate division WWE3 bacterium CG10_big_fil_rev_8_21_14_0_10_32_10 TaxID=1975090 RepID=A0A2H0RAY1_UNCKA|nr:MAG: hypothetical protein COV24_01765 [candidate division WWE3 bacterium CG10_big_fil_rev_8_21_14_0_10_32_10]
MGPETVIDTLKNTVDDAIQRYIVRGAGEVITSEEPEEDIRVIQFPNKSEMGCVGNQVYVRDPLGQEWGIYKLRYNNGKEEACTWERRINKEETRNCRLSVNETLKKILAFVEELEQLYY